MKFPHIRTLGAERGWYRVGPLARVQIADFRLVRQAEAERKFSWRLAAASRCMARCSTTGRA